ncbi:MAG TPA: DNA primase [Anaerolineae bacterium]|nr:DNA primase [Anaerolineae bacterium]
MGVVDEIKDRVDVVEFVSQYVPLQKAGRNFKGLCPFHADTTPSFVVFPDGQRWHCFGACATGGDVFTFLMKKENLEFSEALGILAQRAGITLTPRTKGQQKHDERSILLGEINSAAAHHFHHLLLDSPQAQPGREYLEKRKMLKETWRTFHLGYSLPEWEALKRHLAEKGYGEEDVLAAGLTVEREGGGSYDRFRGRLVFPIHNARGGVVGFGGRALDDSLAKYVNTPQTPIFDKGSILYGVHLARQAIRDEATAIIVEGYMDVLMAHQHGFKNVVASMGTALTEVQVQALRRLTKSFTLAMDADAAGQQASLRGLEVVKKHYGVEHRQSPVIRESYRHIWLKRYVDANIKVITMPEGLDPDDVIRTDPGQWAALVQGALPLMDYYFQVATAGRDLDSAEGKSGLVRQLLPLISELGDGIERAHYLQKLARLIRIDERTLAAEMTRARPRGGAEKRADDGRTTSLVRGAPALESYCLALLMGAPKVIQGVQDLSADDFLCIENRSIFLALKNSLERQSAFDLEEFRTGLDPVLEEHLDSMLEGAGKGPVVPEEEVIGEIERSLSRLRDRKDRRELLELESLLRDGQESGTDGSALLDRVEGLRQRIRERQRHWQGKHDSVHGGAI